MVGLFFQRCFNGFLVELWNKNFGDQDDIELQNDTGGEGRVAHLMYGAAWRRTWGFWFKLGCLGCLAQKNASLFLMCCMILHVLWMVNCSYMFHMFGYVDVIQWHIISQNLPCERAKTFLANPRGETPHLRQFGTLTNVTVPARTSGQADFSPTFWVRKCIQLLYLQVIWCDILMILYICILLSLDCL